MHLLNVQSFEFLNYLDHIMILYTNLVSILILFYYECEFRVLCSALVVHFRLYLAFRKRIDLFFFIVRLVMGVLLIILMSFFVFFCFFVFF